MNVLNKLKNLIQNKDEHEEIQKKQDLDNRIKIEKELLSISSRKKPENIINHREIKYSRNTNFKNLSPLKINKLEKFSNVKNSSPKNYLHTIAEFNNSSLIQNNIQQFNTESNLDERHKQDCLKSDLKKEINYFDSIKNKIKKLNNANNQMENRAIITDNSIIEKNNTLKSLEILNYVDKKAIEQNNDNSTIQGVNKLSSNQLKLNDLKNYLKENSNSTKYIKDKINNNFVELTKASKSKTNKEGISQDSPKMTLRRIKKRSNSYTSLDQLIIQKKNFLQNLIDGKIADKEFIHHNTSYERKNSNVKNNFKENDINNMKNKAYNSLNLNNLSKKIEKRLNSEFSNNNNNNINYKNINYYKVEKNKDLNLNNIHNKIKYNPILTTNGNTCNILNSQSNQGINSKSEFIFENSNKKISEKIEDFNFNFNLKIKANAVQKSNNSVLVANSYYYNKGLLFDDKISYVGNSINNDFSKKISNLNNISNHTRIKLNEINCITERLKTLGDKEKSNEILKNKKLFDFNRLNSEEAIHTSNLFSF